MTNTYREFYSRTVRLKGEARFPWWLRLGYDGEYRGGRKARIDYLLLTLSSREQQFL